MYAVCWILYYCIDKTSLLCCILYYCMEKTNLLCYILYYCIDKTSLLCYILYYCIDKTSLLYYILYYCIDKTSLLNKLQTLNLNIGWPFYTLYIHPTQWHNTLQLYKNKQTVHLVAHRQYCLYNNIIWLTNTFQFQPL